MNVLYCDFEYCGIVKRAVFIFVKREEMMNLFFPIKNRLLLTNTQTHAHMTSEAKSNAPRRVNFNSRFFLILPGVI